MDEIGLESAVLYPTRGLSVGKMVDYDWANAVCRAYNNWLSETYVQRDSRFKGMALLPMQEPAAAAEELERSVTELGYVGNDARVHGSPEPAWREDILARVQGGGSPGLRRGRPRRRA